MQKIHIGKLLLENKLITQEQLDSAIAQQKVTGERLGKILADLNYVKKEQFLQFLSQQLGLPYIDLKNYGVKPEIVQALPEFYARRLRAIVLKKEESGYLVGMVDPLDVVAVDELSKILKTPIKIALVAEDDLLHTIDNLYRKTEEISTLAGELSVELGKNRYNVTQLGEGLSAQDAPVVKLLQSIFEDAVQVNASDIHIEPEEHHLRIRQRIDGVLHEQIIKEKNVDTALALRLKLMGGINITEKRLPQDGRFTIKIKGKTFDVRLATLPVQYGESIVMRLLPQTPERRDLSQLGMPENILEHLRKILSLPHGILLVTGPTGSGKTTSLYAALSELNSITKKIITVEDPVEYRLSGINQVQVQPIIDFTFARALRAILRQDPDIIMIGELRDEETVAIALRAAMTGHLVLSTLHTNDAISSAVRLLDMGAEGYLIAAVLRGIIAQRLVRRICRNCIKDTELTVQERAWLNAVGGTYYPGLTYKAGVGCSYCHHTGYKGQIGIYELVEMTPELGSLLRENTLSEFTALAKQQDIYRPLLFSGLDLAARGVTTVSEVIRVTGESLVESAALTGVAE